MAGLSPRRKIAYIKRGLFSFSNVRTGEQLRSKFPEFDIEEIDVVRDILRRNEWIVLVNFVWILASYWRDLITRRQTVPLAFYRTPYIFGKVRELIRQRLGPRTSEFAFSIQTQSLYDASVPGLPHFVYTDHTHLANLTYPGFPSLELFSHQWIDLEQDVYRHARHVFVMSEHVRQSLVEQYGIDGNQVSCVCAGSNVDPSQVALENDDYSNKTILFVGLDWERKGGPSLLKAFEIVAAEEPSARLIIVGCHPTVTHPNVQVLGRVSRDEVKRQMTRATVFCLPTRVEPFGIVVVEAFHHRLPVVATSIGALPDLVVDGLSGRLVAPDDPRSLAAALTELLRDPAKCRRFGEHGHTIVREHYTWEAVGRKLRTGIMSVLDGSPPVS